MHQHQFAEAQLDVVELFTSGYSVKEVSESLSKSLSFVRRNLEKTRLQVDAHTRGELRERMKAILAARRKKKKEEPS